MPAACGMAREGATLSPERISWRQERQATSAGSSVALATPSAYFPPGEVLFSKSTSGLPAAGTGVLLCTISVMPSSLP